MPVTSQHLDFYKEHGYVIIQGGLTDDDLEPIIQAHNVIVDEIVNAVHYCHANAKSWGADANDIHLVGHSAGAHLAAEMMLHEWDKGDSAPRAIKSVAALTGLYEPEVILSVSVNDEAQVTRDTALARNCLNRPFALSPRTLIAVGAQEPTGWQEQSQAFHRACAEADVDASLEIVAGANHFSLLDRALTAGDPLHVSMTDLWHGRYRG